MTQATETNRPQLSDEDRAEPLYQFTAGDLEDLYNGVADCRLEDDDVSLPVFAELNEEQQEALKRTVGEVIKEHLRTQCDADWHVVHNFVQDLAGKTQG